MKGFHIDMNGLLYKKDYLKQWLQKLSDDGYDTIIWELENGVKWDTCPECNDADALSKDDFKEILAFAKKLHFESIPLLQTIGHAEYVFKNKEYLYMAENPAEFRQYCTQSKEVIEFLYAWIHEYLDLFGDIKYFHIGADEAYDLGFCPKCQEKANKTSLSELYIDHINLVVKPLLEKKIKPIIWADMILHHHEAIDKLDKRITVYDWMYKLNKNSDEIHIWGDGFLKPETINERAKKRFNEFIYPKGKLTHDVFYTSAFLTKNQFQTVLCSASSSYGDNVFCPVLFHIANCFDFMQKSFEKHLAGHLLTSWTVHLLPWEIQNICISMNRFLLDHPTGSLDEYKKWFSDTIIGKDSMQFWQAIELMATPLPLALTRDIGHSKDNVDTPKDTILKSIDKYLNKQSRSEFIRNIEEQISKIEKAKSIFIDLKKNSNSEDVRIWLIAANNLLHRGYSVLAILNNDQLQKEKMIEEAKKLKNIYFEYFSTHLQENRLNTTINRLFDPLVYALQNS